MRDFDGWRLTRRSFIPTDRSVSDIAQVLARYSVLQASEIAQPSGDREVGKSEGRSFTHPP